MNVNYDNVFKDIVKNIKGTPTVLLHSCCAPCSSQVLARLSDYFLVTVLYYNPNIEPFSEYEKRKEEQKRFIETFPSKNKISILDCDYENEKFKCIAKGLEDAPEGGERCHKCYNLRLEKTAILAKENGFDYFCTTLTVSPFKNSRILNEIGSNLEKLYDVKYLYSDFKKEDGYKKSIEYSKKYNLYRQTYCGCIYSKNNLK